MAHHALQVQLHRVHVNDREKNVCEVISILQNVNMAQHARSP